MKKGQIGLMILIIIGVALIAGIGLIIYKVNGGGIKQTCNYTATFGPDKICTPGTIEAVDVTTICASGYPEEARDVSTATKKKVYAMYGIKNPSTGQYQIDHLVPLGLGGTNEVTNLWPQPLDPKPGYKEKDNAERKLHELVCNNRIPLASAQYMMANNWQVNTGLYN